VLYSGGCTDGPSCPGLVLVTARDGPLVDHLSGFGDPFDVEVGASLTGVNEILAAQAERGAWTKTSDDTHKM
jgi:hypothetical protein